MHYMAKELGERDRQVIEIPGRLRLDPSVRCVALGMRAGNRYRARVDLVGLVLLGEIHDH